MLQQNLEVSRQKLACLRALSLTYWPVDSHLIQEQLEKVEVLTRLRWRRRVCSGELAIESQDGCGEQYQVRAHGIYGFEIARLPVLNYTDHLIRLG